MNEWGEMLSPISSHYQALVLRNSLESARILALSWTRENKKENIIWNLVGRDFASTNRLGMVVKFLTDRESDLTGHYKQ